MLVLSLKEYDGKEKKFRFEAEKRKINDKSIHNKLKRFVGRTGTVQIGLFCSLSACVVHYMNLRIEFKEILSVSLRNSLVFIFSLLLFGVVLLINKTGRNEKCLFLSYFLIVVRKKDMVIKPVKNVFFAAGNLVFYYVCESGSIQAGSFESCIQMDTDANEHCPEREMILSPYL